MDRREFTKKLIIAEDDSSMSALLAVKIAELERGLEIVKISDIPKPSVLEITNPYCAYVDDYTIYNPNKPSKRGSKFTPKKKKRKKH
jgi:hypothetical protein